MHTYTPAHEPFHCLGNLELSERRPHAALEHYREALRQTPDDAELLFNTAVAHDQAGELADAVSMYERAREGMLSKKRVGGDTDDDDDGEHMARVLERLDMLLRSARARLVASSEADKGK